MTREDRYVAGSGPVNRRTAGPAQAAPAPRVAPAALERVRAKAARQRLGAPLAVLLRPSAEPVARIGPRLVGGAMAGTAGGVGLFLAWLQQAPLFAGLGLVGLVAGGWLVRAGRVRRPASSMEEAVPPLFDAASLARVDASLDQVAAVLPDAAAERLRAIKELLAGIARHGAVPDGEFTSEDRLWVGECVRRYLPDSLEAWIRVPAAGRATQVLEGGKTADALLLEQLEMLQEGLAVRGAKAAKSAAEGLLRQQRFLQAKKRG